MQHGEVIRTVKGPCVECESDDWPCSCSCHYSGIGDFSDLEQTKPTPKLRDHRGAVSAVWAGCDGKVLGAKQ